LRRIFRFRNLQQKLGIYSFLVSLLALTAVSSLGYRIASSQIQFDREQLMESEAGQIVQQIEEKLNDAKREVKLWGELEAIQAGTSTTQSRPARTFLDNFLKQDSKYDLIFTVDRNGLITSINSTAANAAGKPLQFILPDVPSSWLEDILESGTVKGALLPSDWKSFQKSQVAYVNALYNRTADSPVESRYQFVLGAPVVAARGSDEKLGVVIAVVNWSTFQHILDGAEDRFKRLGLTTGYAFLYAPDGDTITAHKYRELYGTRATVDHNLWELHDRIVRHPTGTFRYRWVEGWKIAALGTVQSDLGPAFNWYLGVGINDTDIFAPLQNIRAWFVAIPFAIAISVLLLTSILARKMSVSLGEFAQLARDAAHGRFSQLVRAQTDDELGDLAQAFNEMLVSFRAQMPFTQIPNRYVVGNPVRRAEMFFGRHEDLQWIGHQLGHSGNKMILLFGARRIGKTSLLHQIYAGRSSPDILPFFFDTQQIIPEIDRDSDFYHVLTREMLAQLPTVIPGVRVPFIAAERFTPETFRNLLKFIRDSEPQKHPVLLFDELENLELKFARGSLTSDLLLFLSSLLDGPIPVGFVASGSDQLEKLRFPGWNILRAKTIPRRIGLLKPADTLRLILEPVRSYVLYDEGIPEQILRATAGHPYYTQVVCQTMVDYLNHKRDFAVGPEQLQEILDQVLDNPPPPLNHVWDGFTDEEKLTLAALAYVLKEPPQYAAIEEIHERIPAEIRGQIPEPGAFVNACDHLCREDWLEKNSSIEYRFQVDLLRRWIAREHSIWQVTDDLKRSAIQ
jgi:HAMP domain-containing protein